MSAKLAYANGICNFRRLWNDMFGRVGGQYTTASQNNAIRTNNIKTKIDNT